MAPEQQAELRTQARSDPACVFAYAARDLDALAALLSVGRMRLAPRTIGERGVRDLLGPTQGARLIRLLRQLAEGTPDWLEPLLTSAGIPADERADYADTLASAYPWLLQEAGIDVGSETVQNMLSLLSNAPNADASSIAKIKAIGFAADPLSRMDVMSALFNDDGTEKE